MNCSRVLPSVIIPRVFAIFKSRRSLLPDSGAALLLDSGSLLTDSGVESAALSLYYLKNVEETVFVWSFDVFCCFSVQCAQCTYLF